MEPLSHDLEKVKAEFKKYDKNGDGVLSKDEMEAFLEKGHSTLTKREVNALFRRVDQDKNGSINFNEFVDYIYGKGESRKGESRQPGKNIEGVPWSKTVVVPEAYREFGSAIPETAVRAMTLCQINELAEVVKKVVSETKVIDVFNGNVQVTWETVNMYHIDPNIVKALTLRFKCSFVELAAKHGPQPAKWFVSHWWGTPFVQTVALLNFHAKLRELPMDTTYWICTFANNQHDLSGLATSDLHDTPFVQALLSKDCSGTVTLLDQHATTLTRIWCVLENYVSTTLARDAEKGYHYYDIAAWLPENTGTWGGQPIPAKPTVRMDAGTGKMIEAVEDEQTTGGAFPLIVSQRGMKIDLSKANASVEKDKWQILHCIAGSPTDKFDEPAPEHSDNYDKVNENAHRMFAPGAMQAAALRGDVQELESLMGTYPDLVDEGVGDGATPLHAAVFKGHMAVLRSVLGAKTDPNVAKRNGTTATFLTAQSGQMQTLQVLLAAGADPSIARDDGVSPLFMAVQKKFGKIGSILLAAKADVEQVTKSGNTALMLAVQQRRLDAVNVLLDAGADPNKATDSGTPLQIAKSQPIIKALKAAGATPASPQRGGVARVPLGAPSMRGAYEVVADLYGELDDLDGLGAMGGAHSLPVSPVASRAPQAQLRAKTCSDGVSSSSGAAPQGPLRARTSSVGVSNPSLGSRSPGTRRSGSPSPGGRAQSPQQRSAGHAASASSSRAPRPTRDGRPRRD